MPGHAWHMEINRAGDRNLLYDWDERAPSHHREDSRRVQDVTGRIYLEKERLQEEEKIAKQQL